jgi:hypothetical protein
MRRQRTKCSCGPSPQSVTVTYTTTDSHQSTPAHCMCLLRPSQSCRSSTSLLSTPHPPIPYVRLSRRRVHRGTYATQYVGSGVHMRMYACVVAALRQTCLHVMTASNRAGYRRRTFTTQLGLYSDESRWGRLVDACRHSYSETEDDL